MASKKQLQRRIVELEAELAFLIGAQQERDACDQRGLIVRPWSPEVDVATSTAAPWCSLCQGFHIPGAGPCTMTWSRVS